MVYPPVRDIIHSLKLVDCLQVQADKPFITFRVCYINHFIYCMNSKLGLVLGQDLVTQCLTHSRKDKLFFLKMEFYFKCFQTIDKVSEKGTCSFNLIHVYYI